MTIISSQAVSRSQIRAARLAGQNPKFAVHYKGKPYEYTECLEPTHEGNGNVEDMESAQNYRAMTQEGCQFV